MNGRKKKICMVKGCGKPARTLGICDMHRKRRTRAKVAHRRVGAALKPGQMRYAKTSKSGKVVK